MTREEILLKVQNIFRDVLENDSINLTDDMSADDIEEYDSLAHIQLVVAIELEFKIKFSAKDIISWNSIGEMIDCIERYL